MMSDVRSEEGPYSPQTAFCLPAWDWSRGCHPPAAVLYNDLGFHLNNKLDWSDPTNVLSKKGQCGCFLQRKPTSFGAKGTLQQIPYDCGGIGHLFQGSLLSRHHLCQGEKAAGQTGQENQLFPGLPGGCWVNCSLCCKIRPTFSRIL